MKVWLKILSLLARLECPLARCLCNIPAANMVGMGETADGKFMNFCGLKGTYSDSGSKYYGK